MKKFIREPFVHFLAIGVILFIGHSLWAAHNAKAASTISVSEAEMERQALIFAGEQRRIPSDDDLEALLYAYVEEEVLVREAQRRGLGADDTIIRRRLAQKMRFLIEDVAPPQPPSDDVLKAWFDANRPAFTVPMTLDFTHIYFSPDSGDPHVRAAKLRAKIGPEDSAETLGDPFIMKRSYKDRSPQAITRLFGSAFAQTIVTAPVQSWSQPIDSAFGVHLVKVQTRRDSVLPQFKDIRAEVLAKWTEETVLADNANRLSELISGYEVEVQDE